MIGDNIGKVGVTRLCRIMGKKFGFDLQWEAVGGFK